MKPNTDIGQKGESLSCPVVAIGASAGGLYALQCFLAALPGEFGFAVVFMQHLSPKHRSLLPELIRNRRPDLEVNEISDGLKVLPGKLFLCPAGKEIAIRKGTFRVAQRTDEAVYLPIDEFFSSLAEEAGELAIGVIFSGAGTDGARGIRDIRTAGGTVFVQEPSTAEFPSMPVAAIGTGQADGVLPPEDIAREIIRLHGEGPDGPDRDISPVHFEILSRLIHEKTGYSFTHYKMSVVSRRIKRRMSLKGIQLIQDYIKVVAEKDSEAAVLAGDLMIGVTSFFRDRLAWKALRTGVIRNLAAQDEDEPVRVWTPACATGEEAYSIAMMLRTEFDLAGRRREIQVFATDVNDAALEKAREGKYPGSISADVPADYMRKFFACAQDGISVIIGKEIRESVVFAKQDLLSDPPFSRLDLIICRNLLIYLEPDAQAKCISLFHYALKEGGYLFLGNAESTGRNSQLFRSLAHKKCRIYQKVHTDQPARLSLSVPLVSERASSAPLRRSSDFQQPVIEFVQQALLEESGPPAVAINGYFDIIYNNGPTHRYLRQPRGAPTQNLLELLPEGLRGRIRGALYRAAHEARSVSIRVSIPYDDRKRRVSLRLSRLKEDLFLVVFVDKGSRAEQAEAVPSDEAVGDETTMLQLESELSATRADLQSNIEQLKSLNEELQSSNEELQAANEELETSREELQSLNEELITVNSQLQSKIEEQEETNNDLNNFLSSTNIPTMFLDRQLSVKRFTPAMSRLIRLIPADMGRPIIDMSQDHLGPDLVADAESVLEHLTPISREIETKDERYVRTALPYRTSDDRIEGVVITYNDVTWLKRQEERTRHLASFPQMNPNPVIEVDSSGRVVFVNPGTLKILAKLGSDSGEVSAFLPGDLQDILRDWDGKTEKTLNRETVVRGRVFGSTIHFVPQFQVVRIYSHDISERKLAEEEILRSEAEYRNLFDSSTDGIFIMDFEGNFVDANRTSYERLGYTREEFLSLNIKELDHPCFAGQIRERFEQIFDSGAAVFESAHLCKDGSTMPVEVNARVFEHRGKQVFFSVVRDITERKRAEKALIESEAQFRTLADTIPNLAWWANSDGYITWYNKRWYEYTGTTPEEMAGWGWQSVHDPELLPKVMDRWQKSIATGEPLEMEFPLRGADGVFRPFLTRVLPLKDSAGHVLRWLGTNTDISMLKEAEKEIRRSELRYRSYIEVTNQWAWVTDPAGMVVEDIPALRNFTGQTYEQARGSGWADALHPDDVPHTLEVWSRAVASRTTYETEYRMRRYDGVYRVLLARGVPIFDDEGSVVEWVGTCIDITERKHAEEELKESLSRFELLTVTASELLQSTEPQQVVESVCRKVMEYLDCHAFFNFLVDEQSGKLHLNACAGIPEEEAKRIEWLEFGVAVCGCAARDSERIIAEHIPTTPDERTELVKSYGIKAYCCHPLIGPGGKVLGTLSFGTCSRETFSEGDISMMKAVTDQVTTAMIRMRDEADVLKMGEDMARRNVELESANRELESFIYSISHDLRAPLRSMGGFARIMVEEYSEKLDEQGRDYLRRIRNASEKMSLLIEDLLNLSKISRQELKRAEVDLTKMARTLVTDMSDAAPSRKVEVVIQEGLTVIADTRLIEIVLSNLLGNAWKFTSKTEHAKIEFGMFEREGKITYYVRDNGAGFNPLYSEKMFWPFQRLHSDKEFEGTGIGLTVVEWIIRRHGGKIWAEGEVGKGATVFFGLH